ncbi:MAG: GNAT family N-acetyltransferase [Acidobacteriia bacterium]|nr:GNAT family N-acetyltransferase [Terriglobia bacterium]
MTSRYDLRPVRPTDRDFLFGVYCSSREEEMRLVNWEESQKQVFLTTQFEAQQAEYSRRFPEANHQIILSDGEPVGHLHIDRTPREIHIIDVAILSKHRGRGIGTAILNTILSEGKEQRKAVRIYVEVFNRSQPLLARLGFSPIEDAGVYSLWEWNPEASSAH